MTIENPHSATAIPARRWSTMSGCFDKYEVSELLGSGAVEFDFEKSGSEDDLDDDDDSLPVRGRGEFRYISHSSRWVAGW